MRSESDLLDEVLPDENEKGTVTEEDLDGMAPELFDSREEILREIKETRRGKGLRSESELQDKLDELREQIDSLKSEYPDSTCAYIFRKKLEWYSDALEYAFGRRDEL